MLDAVQDCRPDAVVSDMNMPRLDGLGLCRAVRALPGGDSVPIILWTSAERDDPRVQVAVACGGVEFFSKSLAVTKMDAVLRQMLRGLVRDTGQPGADAAVGGEDQVIASRLVDVAA